MGVREWDEPGKRVILEAAGVNPVDCKTEGMGSFSSSSCARLASFEIRTFLPALKVRRELGVRGHDEEEAANGEDEAMLVALVEVDAAENGEQELTEAGEDSKLRFLSVGAIATVVVVIVNDDDSRPAS